MSTEQYYDRYWSDAGHNPRDVRLPKVVESLLEKHIKDGAAVLDVGCGAGDKVNSWVKHHSIEYTGVDVSHEAVSASRKLGLNSLHIDDVTRLPFPDDKFESAISFEVMEHLFEPLGAMREVYRVLRPGGVVILTVPNTAYILKRMQMLRGIWNPGGDELSVAEPWRDPHIRFFTLQTLSRMCEYAGFSLVEIGGHQDPSSQSKPSLKARLRRSEAYSRLEEKRPGLLGKRLHLVGLKLDETR